MRHGRPVDNNNCTFKVSLNVQLLKEFRKLTSEKGKLSIGFFFLLNIPPPPPPHSLNHNDAKYKKVVQQISNALEFIEGTTQIETSRYLYDMAAGAHGKNANFYMRSK